MGSTIQDLASTIYPVPAMVPLSVIAGGAADGVEQTGVVIDRQSAELDRFNGHHSCVLAVLLSDLDIVTDETVSFVANLETDDLVGFASPTDFAPPIPPVGDHPLVTVARTMAGAVTAELIVLTQSYDLQGAERFLRVQTTVTFSAAVVDNGFLHAALIFGGFRSEEVGPLSGAALSLL